MSDKIKCTYGDCFRHFKTVEAMKKHKAKDPAHDSYCSKCDLDCNDDARLMPLLTRTVACPICGQEFKSEGGRDRHVEVDHIPKQNLSCPGCQLKFDRAASFMSHIERDECEVIRYEHFARQKAEQQINQDVLDAALDPTAGTTVLSNARSYATTNNEMILLDDERAFVNTNWQGQPQYDENDETEHNGPYVDAPSDMMSNLSILRFPPLGLSNRVEPEDLPLITNPASTSNKPKPAPQRAQIPAPSPWAANTNTASHLFNTESSQHQQPYSNSKRQTPKSVINDTASINLLDSFKDDDFPMHPSENSTLSRASNIAQPSTFHTNIPRSTHAPNPDPNHQNAHIQQTTPFNRPSRLSAHSFFDPVLNKYICPSITCGAHFSSPQSFHDHLLRPPHADNKITCPSCYKKFKSTTALVTHCESGSRKCKIRNAVDYDRVLRQITAGFMIVDGVTPEGGVRYVAAPVER